MEKQPIIIKGGSHSDLRGSINFFNSFDMAQVKRFYVIQNSDTWIKRGWRGHKIEQRWFYAADGEFRIQLVKIDNWEKPTLESPVIEFILSAAKDEVLHIPAGYASCIQCIEANSKLFVFADYGVEHAKEDDYLYPEDYFDQIEGRLQAVQFQDDEQNEQLNTNTINNI